MCPASALLSRLWGPWPATHATMQPAGSPYGKYISRDGAITPALLAAHLAGSVTLAAPPIGADGLARFAALDIDAGGEQAVQRALAAAAALGLAAWAEAHDTPGGHQGGRVFIPLILGTHPNRARLLAALVRDRAGLPANTEVLPTKADLRLPLGVHRHTGRRGVLLAGGQRFDLNDAQQLAGAVAAVGALDNDPAVCPELPALDAPAACAAHQGPSSIAELNAGASVADMIQLLESRFGCHYVRTSPSGAMLRCGCGHHAHGDQKPSLRVYTGRGGKVLVSGYSPSCKWAERRATDYADVYCQAHGLSYRDLAAPAGRRSGGAPAAPGDADRRHTDPAQLAARKADAERKRRQRAEGAAATLQAVQDRAAEDRELAARPTVAAVLRELLVIAGRRDWCRPSKAQIGERLDVAERTVQRALAWLEGRYIVTEQHVTEGGVAWRGGPQTARRTFLREPLRRVETPQTPEVGETSGFTAVSPVLENMHVLDTCLDPREGGATAAAASDPGPLDDAGWSDLLAAAPEPVADDVAAELAAWPMEQPSAPAEATSCSAAAPLVRQRLRDSAGLDWHLEQLAALDRYRAEQQAAAPRPAGDDLVLVLRSLVDAEHAERIAKLSGQAWAMLGRARKPGTPEKQRRFLRQSGESLLDQVRAMQAELWPVAAEVAARLQAGGTAEQETAEPGAAPPSQAPAVHQGDLFAYVPPAVPSAPRATHQWGSAERAGLIDRLRQLNRAA